MPAKAGPLRPHEQRLNYARREPKEPLPGEPKIGDSFLIVTEGEVTERLYFESLRETLKPNILNAVNRAIQVREYHQKGASPFPANPSTELDLLVRALDASVQPPLRILRWI